jgi:cell division protein FtsL
MLRGLNLIAVGGLVAAAVVVYDVKYSATYEAQKVARLNNEIHQEREKIAALKAEWSVLSAPERIQRLATKYLGMKPLPVSHIGGFASLPERVTISGDPIGDIINSLDKNGGDPIGRIIEKLESAQQDEPETTGSINAPQQGEAEPIGTTQLPELTGTIGDEPQLQPEAPQ